MRPLRTAFDDAMTGKANVPKGRARPECGRSALQSSLHASILDLASSIAATQLSLRPSARIVTVPGRRERAGCLAHVRRKFFDARYTTLEAQTAIDFIVEVLHVERAALDDDLLGTDAHLELRQSRSGQVMSEFKAWLEAEQPKHLPRGPMGEAISYALGQWDALTKFLADARIPVDNNASENALRAAALVRKNWLFVGHDEAGELLSRDMTCEANGVNPAAYIADVLLRVRTHRVVRVDELLPHRRKPPRPGPSTSCWWSTAANSTASR